ncbi:MAG: HAD family hydrolase [Lachnospiraceae bacterium]|nr:HAD family hydrolase [Lachnospiraceae bacterium]
MNRKIFFFDIDGTIVGDSRKLRQANLDAILRLKEQGHLIFICTGRAPVSIDKYLWESGFTGVIASAGSFIYVGKEKIYENCIDKELLKQTLQLFEENDVYPTLETENAVYQHTKSAAMFLQMELSNLKNNLEMLRRFEDLRKTFVTVPLDQFDIDTVPVPKLSYMAQDTGKFENCLPFLEEHYHIVTFDRFRSKFAHGELIQKSCTKGHAVKFLCDYYGIPLADSYGFGDSMNDYEMLEVCGHSYACSESPDSLKAVADGEFLPPDSDGMAKLLNQLPL